MSYILTIAKKKQADRDAAIEVEKRNQLYADMLKQQLQISQFPDAQIITAPATYSTMIEDTTALSTMESRENAREQFVILLQKYLTKVSAENVAKKLDIYKNKFEMYNGISTYYTGFKTFVESQKLTKYNMSTIHGLVVQFLQSKGLKGQTQDVPKKKNNTSKQPLTKAQHVELAINTIHNSDRDLKMLMTLPVFDKVRTQTGISKNKTMFGRLSPIELDKIIDFFKYDQDQGLSSDNDYETATEIVDDKEEASGNGLQKMRNRNIYAGRGASKPKKNTELNHGSSLYVLDIGKLKKNILSLKYRSTNNLIIKPTKISDAVRDLLMDMYEGSFNERSFDRMNDEDQAIVQLFIDSIKMTDDINIKNNKLEELFYDFEKARGQLQAGNNSNDMINELRKTTLALMKLKKINKSTGNSILVHLNV